METEAVKSLVPRALPGRVILKFPEQKTEIKEGNKTLIHLIQGSTATKDPDNIAKVVSIGLPTDRAEEVFCQVCKEGDFVIADPVYGSEFWVNLEDGTQDEYKIFRIFEITGLAPEGYKP